jgi:hypothetical protein
MRLLLAGSMLAAVLIALTISATAIGTSSCGTVKAYYHEHGTTQYVEASSIRASGVGCGRARGVARDWASKSRLSYKPASGGAGFACSYNRVGSDVGKTTCRKGSASVHFGAYDSSPYH